MSKTLLALPVAGMTALCLAGAAPALAAEEPKVVPADQVQWGPAPPSLPPGAQVAVLSGDPSAEEGHFIMRVRFPPNYEVPAHNHPTTEFVTVLDGTFGFGYGDTLDRSKGQELRPGSLVRVPANHNHFAWAGSDGVTFQLHGQSPFAIEYVDPAKDPRRTAAATTR